MEQYSGAGTLEDRFIVLDIYYQYVYLIQYANRFNTINS